MNVSFEVGDSEGNVIKNRDKMLSFLGVDRNSLASMRQIHSDNVQRITEPGVYPQTDALMTSSPGIVLAVTVADCLPILIHDPTNEIIAAIHTGWRGALQSIVSKSVDKMSQSFNSDPKDLIVYVGAGAGSCCYEVQSDVANLFSDNFIEKKAGSIFLDLRRHVRAELISAGVMSESIEENHDCTICERIRYHSYRRDKEKSGRMMACIMIK